MLADDLARISKIAIVDVADDDRVDLAVAPVPEFVRLRPGGLHDHVQGAPLFRYVFACAGSAAISNTARAMPRSASSVSSRHMEPCNRLLFTTHYSTHYRQPRWPRVEKDAGI